MKLTVVLDYYNAIGTYSRIGLLQCNWNLQSYWLMYFHTGLSSGQMIVWKVSDADLGTYSRKTNPKTKKGTTMVESKVTLEDLPEGEANAGEEEGGNSPTAAKSKGIAQIAHKYRKNMQNSIYTFSD